jgi:hypothetical protein
MSTKQKVRVGLQWGALEWLGDIAGPAIRGQTAT